MQNNKLDFKKLLKIFFVTAGLTFLFFIILAIYLTVTDSGNESKSEAEPIPSESTASSESIDSAANLPAGDQAYQEVFTDYEKSYVYYINQFGTQLTEYETGETTKEELLATITEFEQILNPFLAATSDTTTENFNESKVLAVSSAYDTLVALEGLETIIKTENTTNYEKTTENMKKGVEKFTQSQEKFMATVKTFND